VVVSQHLRVLRETGFGWEQLPPVQPEQWHAAPRHPARPVCRRRSARV